MTCEFPLGEDGLDYVLQSILGSCGNFAFIKDLFRPFVKDFFLTHGFTTEECLALQKNKSEDIRNYWLALMFLSYEIPMFFHGSQRSYREGCRAYQIHPDRFQLYFATSGFYPLTVQFQTFSVLDNLTKLTVNGPGIRLESKFFSSNVIRQSVDSMETFYEQCSSFFPNEIMRLCLQYAFSPLGLDRSGFIEKSFQTGWATQTSLMVEQEADERSANSDEMID